MDFGRFSTYVETIDQPEIDGPARQLLKAIRYTGVVEVEFKRDPRDGCCKLLDINPRVWGWYTLCARAGVDFTRLLWLQAHVARSLNNRQRQELDGRTRPPIWLL